MFSCTNIHIKNYTAQISPFFLYKISEQLNDSQVSDKSKRDNNNKKGKKKKNGAGLSQLKYRYYKFKLKPASGTTQIKAFVKKKSYQIWRLCLVSIS